MVCRTLITILVVSLPFAVFADEPTALPKSKVDSLFNGKDLKGWKVVSKDDFQRGGNVAVKDGTIVLDAGKPATGIVRTKPFPTLNYEVSLQAKRIEGNDFFCGLTFPVNQTHCSLIVGGWGGTVTGLSNIDNMSAAENETTEFIQFKNDRWYTVRLRVTETKIEAWLDKQQIVDVETKDRKFSIWWEQEPMRPFGIATWNTKSALRKLTVKRVPSVSKEKSRE